jgi:inner membrane protein
MTERTHDLAGLTALTLAFLIYMPTQISLVTLVAVGIANQIGTAFPDLDQPTAEFYREIPAVSFLGHLLSPLFGTHRHISHSIIGMALYGWVFHLPLNYLAKFILVDMAMVWWSFMLGFLSHLVMDTLTKDGVPWLFPLPVKFGFPPLRFLRITTGKFMEKVGVYTLLLGLNIYLIYSNYGKFVDFFSNRIVR